MLTLLRGQASPRCRRGRCGRAVIGARAAADGEQPPPAPRGWRCSGARVRVSGGRCGRRTLLVIGLPCQIRAMPPAAAQRLEQRRGVGVAIGLRLHEARCAPADRPARRSAARGSWRSRPATALRQIQRDLGRIGGGVAAFRPSASCSSAASVSATFWKAVSTVLRYCSAAWHVGGLRGALLVQQRAALEDRRGRCAAPMAQKPVPAVNS